MYKKNRFIDLPISKAKYNFSSDQDEATLSQLFKIARIYSYILFWCVAILWKD